jgi:hypothetical protein
MVKVVPLDATPIDPARRIGFLKGSGLGEWWDSLDHAALDREIADDMLGRVDRPDGDPA